MQRRRLAMTKALCVFALAWTNGPAVAGEAASDTRFAERWFSARSPWNQAIPENAATLPGSEGFVAAFTASWWATLNINTSIWTPAVLYARSGLPRCAVDGEGWLTRGLPLHPDFVRSILHFTGRGDTDASFCIYDEEKRLFYNLFNVRLSDADDGRRRILIGAVGLFPIDGPGWWDNTKGPWIGRAAGASYCGGLVRDSEYARGRIDHALAIGWPKNLIRNTRMPDHVVFPAKTTDGGGRSAKTAVPMGARLQVDPKLSDAELAAVGVRARELPFVKAMQTYGAYVVDSTDAVMAIYVESDRGRDAAAAGVRPLPQALMKHVRFVEPPEKVELDDRLTQGQPVFMATKAAPLHNCIAE